MKKFLAVLTVMTALMAIFAVPSFAAKEDLVICMPEDLESFDTSASSAMSSQAIYKSIYVLLYGEDTNGQPVDWLAKSLNVISDNEVHVVIHDNYKFSDGSAITAEDVVATLRRCKESPTFNTLMKAITAFDVVNPTTISIKTTGPAPAIKLALMHPNTGILQKAYIEKATAANDWSNPVCSGPFMVAERVVGTRTKLVKNPHFTDPTTSAKSNSITFMYVPEANSRTMLVETGEADVNFSFDTAGYKNAKENPKLKIWEHDGTVTRHLCLDVTLKPFDDKRVRQAVSYAINREDAITITTEGLASPSYAPLPPSTLGYLQNPQNYTYDPEKAKSLLAEAGYPDGFSTKLITFNDWGRRLAEAVQPDLAAVGINVEIETYDFNVRSNMVKQHQVPMMTASWGAMSDADLVLPRLFTEAAIGGTNSSFFHDPRLDKLFEDARHTYDTNARIKLYEESVKILADENPWACILVPTAFCLTTADLKGVELSGESIINFYKLHY